MTRQKKIHYHHGLYMACNTNGVDYTAQLTDDVSKVTCKRCLESIRNMLGRMKGDYLRACYNLTVEE